MITNNCGLDGLLCRGACDKIRNSLGDNGKHAPNSRGLKFLELCNHFNICALNLLSSCNGPVEAFVSHCGRFRSTIDYIFVPNSSLNKVITAKTFEMLPDNTSDHVPIQLYLNYSRSLETIKNLPQQMAEIPVSKQNIHWSNFAQEEIIHDAYNTTYIRT